VPGAKELVGGGEVRAGVAESESLEPDDADRPEPDGERDEKEDDRRPAAQRRDRRF